MLLLYHRATLEKPEVFKAHRSHGQKEREREVGIEASQGYFSLNLMSLSADLTEGRRRKGTRGKGPLPQLMEDGHELKDKQPNCD